MPQRGTQPARHTPFTPDSRTRGRGRGRGGRGTGRGRPCLAPTSTERYHRLMAALNVRFTDEELEALRHRAAAEGRSMQSFVHDAVIQAISERTRLFEDAAAHVLEASAELNRRLA